MYTHLEFSETVIYLKKIYVLFICYLRANLKTLRNVMHVIFVQDLYRTWTEELIYFITSTGRRLYPCCPQSLSTSKSILLPVTSHRIKTVQQQNMENCAVRWANKLGHNQEKLKSQELHFNPDPKAGRVLTHSGGAEVRLISREAPRGNGEGGQALRIGRSLLWRKGVPLLWARGRCSFLVAGLRHKRETVKIQVQIFLLWSLAGANATF